MAKEKINMSELAKTTGIGRNTISKMYNEQSTRIDFETVKTLCSYFDCSIGDLIMLDTDAPSHKENVS